MDQEMNDNISYDQHPREYSLMGSTAIFSSLQDDAFFDYYGGRLSEFISVVKDGVYFHYQRSGERDEMAKKFIEKIKQDYYDLEKEYFEFDRGVSKHEDLINRPEEKYDLETILELFASYKKLANVSLASVDPINVVHGLDELRKKQFIAWANKARLREENVYKHGEMIFMPKYLRWLVKNHLQTYTVEQLWYLVYTELVDYLKNNKPLPSPEELNQRKKLVYVAQYPHSEVVIYTGSQAQLEIDKKNLLPSREKYQDVKELFGIRACGGKVQGFCRLIRKREDMAQFKDGEIIVSPMTEPSYLPIMKKARAIVTEEGGGLCHAAIVARELKIPCVIGTKIATYVFNDGDFIEVDANQGIVKKI